MRIKSYFARTVEDAIALAGRELGPEAMLLNSRLAPPESHHLGEYEVVFAAETPASEEPPEPETAARPAGDALLREMAELRNELDGMRRSISRSMLAPNWV